MSTIVRRLLFVMVTLLFLLVASPFLLIGSDWALIAAGTYDDEATLAVPGRTEVVTVKRRPIWRPILDRQNGFRRTIMVARDAAELLREEIDAGGAEYSMMQVYQLGPEQLLLTDGLLCIAVSLSEPRLTRVTAIDRDKMRFLGAFDDYDRSDGRETSNERHPLRFLPPSERWLRPFHTAPECFKPIAIEPGVWEVSAPYPDPQFKKASLDGLHDAAMRACTGQYSWYEKLREDQLTTPEGLFLRWRIRCH
jgi:hypothetical protein